MDNHVNKRSILEVYSSEEEEIADVNMLQEDFESESAESINSENNITRLNLEIGYIFVYNNM
jgi:hypothetical protein